MKQKTNETQLSKETNKINTLFNRASSSSSNREKNQLLTQIQTIYIDSFSRFEKVIARNSIKEKELAGLQKNFEELQKKLDETRSHLDQKIELENRGIKSNKRNFISNIKETEEELILFGPLERPNLLQNAIEKEEKCEPHLHPILLWDIEMQRYEELVYALQKRIIAVEENEQCSDKVIEEFGSIHGLIDEYKSLTIENSKLKKEETQFLNDPVVRRRINSNISNIAVRSLILTFQKELQNQNSLLSKLNRINQNNTNNSNNSSLEENQINENSDHKEDPVNKAISSTQDFDSMCQDPNFIMSTSVAVIRPDQLEKTTEIELPIESAIEEQTKNVQIAQDQLIKVVNDVSTMRESVFKVDSSVGSQCKRLYELNHRLLNQIQTLQEKIENLNEETIELIQKLNQLISNKNAHQIQTSSFFDPYKDLLADFFHLSGHLCQNIHIDKTLSSVASIFAKDVILEHPTDQILFNYINPLLKEIETKLRLKNEEEKEREREREREREAKKSSRNKNQKLDFQSIISGVQKSAKGQKEHIVTPNIISPPIHIPKSRLSVPSISASKKLSRLDGSTSSTVSKNSSSGQHKILINQPIHKENHIDLDKNEHNHPHHSTVTFNTNVIINSTAPLKQPINSLPLPILQTETPKHHHQKQQNQQLQQHIQQLIAQMQQNKLPRVLTASLLTKLAEISGFIFKKDNISHYQFISTWKAIKFNLTEILKQNMTGYEVEQRHLFSETQFCNNKILVKEKKEIETMTLPLIKVDIETQYEEQKKVKPPPKKK